MAYTGQDFALMMEAGRASIAEHIEEVNALNVFPVPDGDSGTNLHLTMKAAADAVAGTDETHVGKVAAKVSRAALLGARGNSGVIFSQILRGMSKALAEAETFDAATFAAALTAASEQADKSIVDPVEGTILTVMRCTAERAREAAARNVTLLALLEESVAAADEAVGRTTEQLDVLKKAGVVDSAGKGLYFILDGMRQCISGAASGAPRAKEPATAAQAMGPSLAEGERAYGTEVMFVMEGDALDVPAIRRRISEMGESVLVVGDETMVKVHVHTLDPDAVVSYARTLGEPQDLTFEDLDQQAADFRHQHEDEAKLQAHGSGR